jgi:hypothetical protein
LIFSLSSLSRSSLAAFASCRERQFHISIPITHFSSPPHTCIALDAAVSSREDRGLFSAPEPSADLFRAEEYDEDAEEALRALCPPLPAGLSSLPLARLRGERRRLSYELAGLASPPPPPPRLPLRLLALLRLPSRLFVVRLGGVRLGEREYREEDVDADRL